MKFKSTTTVLMCALHDALKQNKNDSLQEILNQIGLEGVLDPDLFKAARFFERRPLLIFLATLGVENSDEKPYFNRWLASSQYLNGQLTLKEASSLCAGGRGLMVDFYCDVLNAVSKPEEQIPSGSWLGLPCQSSDMKFVTEFLLDNSAVQLIPSVLKKWRQIDNTGEPWLWMCRTVAERIEYAKKAHKAEALATALEFLFEEIDLKHHELVGKLSPHMVDLLLKSGRTDTALLRAKADSLRDPGLTSDYWLMMCHARRSEFSEAVLRAQAVLHATVCAALSVSNDNSDEKIDKNLKKSKFDVELAGESLKSINRILRERGLQPFLMSGVLLGYHREGALLAHDKDVDIGLIGWDKQFEVAQALHSTGNYQISWRDIKGQNTYLFDVYDLVNDVTIDFFFFHQHQDHFLHGIDYKYGFTQNLKFSLFELREVEFLGDIFYIPSNVEQNLTENYGDWRTPQSSYVVTVESPAIVDKGSLKHQFIGIMELLRSINKFKSTKRIQRILTYWDGLGGDLVSVETRNRLNDWMSVQNSQ